MQGESKREQEQLQRKESLGKPRCACTVLAGMLWEANLSFVHQLKSNIPRRLLEYSEFRALLITQSP